MHGGFVSAVILSVVATLCIAQPAYAGHRTKSQITESDPCAAPHAFVQERIDRIKALQAPAPKSNGTLFDIFGGQKNIDPQKSVEISNLRYDIDGVNDLLAAGGCQAFDLDRELSTGAK